MNTEIEVKTNPIVIELKGGHKQTVTRTVKCTPGQTFSSGQIDVSVCGDFNFKEEYVTLKILGNFIGDLSSDKDEWKYDTVLTDKDITPYIQGCSEFTIEAIPSAEVHRLWADAWGMLINLSTEFSEKRISISDWKLNERAFEPNENATYTFDIENVSGLELTAVKVSLVKDQKTWKDNGVSAITPQDMFWEFPVLKAGEKKTLALILKSEDATVGKYPLPQVVTESSMVVEKINFHDTNFVVEISED